MTRQESKATDSLHSVAHSYDAPLILDLQPSRWLQAFIVVSFCLAVAGVWQTALPLWGRLLLSMLILLWAVWQYFYWRLFNGCRLQISRDDWRWYYPSGYSPDLLRKIDVTRVGCATVWLKLVIVHLEQREALSVLPCQASSSRVMSGYDKPDSYHLPQWFVHLSGLTPPWLRKKARWAVVIPADSVDQASHRRLRVLLRCG